MKRASMSFGEFCRELLGQPAWPAWEAYADALLGLPLSAEAARLFELCAGRAYAQGTPANESTAIVGRRGGKTWHLVALILFLCLIHPPRRKRSETVWALAIAQDLRVARDVILGYARQSLKDSAILNAEVEEYRADEIRFRSGLRFTARPCTVGAPRGWSVWLALLDELAYWALEGSEPDYEIERGVRHGMLMFPDRLLLKASTPRLRAGVLWRDYQKRAEKDSRIVVWQGSTMTMNPVVDAEEIERMRREDPEGARREIDAEFTDAIAGYFSGDAVQQTMRHGYERLPAVDGRSYVVAIDAAFSRDQFALAVAHREPDGQVIVDLLRVWPPPVAVQATLREVSEIAKQYHTRTVWCDQFSYAALRTLAEQVGMELRQEPITAESKQNQFGTLRGLATAGKLALPKHEILRREMSMLESRQLPSGGARIAAPSGFTDDAVCAVAMAVSKAERAGGGLVIVSEGGKSTVFGPGSEKLPARKRMANYKWERLN